VVFVGVPAVLWVFGVVIRYCLAWLVSHVHAEERERVWCYACGHEPCAAWGAGVTSTLLRRSYRENGKVRKETLANLSHLPPEAIELIRGVLRGESYVPAGGRASQGLLALADRQRQWGSRRARIRHPTTNPT
jgi:hypothetical protein